MSKDTALAMTETAVPVRPLHVLVPLIQKDLKAAKEVGRDAFERAGMPYYQAAGEKMLEAKAQIPYGEFKAWVTRNFKITYTHAHKYMQLAKAAGGNKSFADDFSSLSDFVRKETENKTYNLPHTVRPKPWDEPIKKIMETIDSTKLNIAREEMKRADERDLQRELALKIIDIGYKVLARKLHPDKGGSRDAMSRLNAARERLKLHA